MKTKKYKLIVFDVDGTLTNLDNPWKHIHEHYDLWHKTAVFHKDAFLDNQITYNELCRLEVLHWKGLKVDELYELFRDVEIVENLHKSLIELRKTGFELIAISSGLQFIPERLELTKYLDKVFNNQICHYNGYLNGDVNINVSHSKINVLDEYIEDKNIKYEEIICVGDGENDVVLAESVGYSIAFNAKSEKLKKIATCVIDNKDFGVLKEYLVTLNS